MIQIKNRLKNVEKIVISNQNSCTNQTHVKYAEIKELLKHIETVMRKEFSLVQPTDEKQTQTETQILSVDSEFESKFSFPLNTIEQLQNFNDTIKENENYRQFLIDTFGKLLGNDGKKNGDIVASILADNLFARKMLMHTSWTGVSRTPGLEKKISFQSYVGMVSLFHDIVQNADSEWATCENNAFLKKFVKNANARSKINAGVGMAHGLFCNDESNAVSVVTDEAISSNNVLTSRDNILANGAGDIQIDLVKF